MRRGGIARPADEGGSVLPLVALALVTLMTCAALAVDLGSLAATNRRLQGVADLAAIAGAAKLTGAACNSAPSVFDNVSTAVLTSAGSNKFPITVGGTKTLLVEVGTIAYRVGDPAGSQYFTTIFSSLTPGPCASPVVPSAVRVTAGDNTRYAFGQVVGQGGRTSQRAGTAVNKTAARTGGLMIGSSLADLNTTNSPVLNLVLNGMICPSGSPLNSDNSPCSFLSGQSASASLASYQGLAAAGVTLGQLQARAGAASVSALLNTSMKAGDLYLYSAQALGCGVVAGCSNSAALTLLGLAAKVSGTASFKLGEMITVDAGSEAEAAAATLNVLGLVTGSAQVINRSNFVNIPSIGVSIPNTTSTSLSLKVIEAPQTRFGPVGVSVSTSQVDITATQTLNLLGIGAAVVGGVVSVTGDLPVHIAAGSATGTLAQVNCAPKGEVVSVDTTGATTAIGDTSTANKFLSVKLGPVALAGLNVNATASVAGINGSPLAFSYPSEYIPATMTPKHTGGTTLNVQGTALNTSVGLGVLGLDISAVTSALTGSTGAVTKLDTVISGVLRALGIDVGGADVWALGTPGCPTAVPVISG